MVTVTANSDEKRTISKIMRKGNQGRGDSAGPGRHALGAQELRALSVLVTAGMVPPLRYKPAQVSELERAIVAL
jgi:hypothetical protein